LEVALDKLELEVNCDVFIIVGTQVKVVLRADYASAMLDKVAVISGSWCLKGFEYDNF
jgi:hypothetical protein